MRIQVIPFRARHVPLVNPNADENLLALAYAAERSGKAFTGCLLGDPVGCAGVWMHGTEGQVWTLFSPLIKQMPVALCKEVRRRLKEVIEELQPTLLYARIDTNDEQAVRFIERLGFEAGHRLYERRF